MNEGRMSMDDWKKAIAAERAQREAVKERKPIAQQLAEATVKADAANAARHGASEMPEKPATPPKYIDFSED